MVDKKYLIAAGALAVFASYVFFSWGNSEKASTPPPTPPTSTVEVETPDAAAETAPDDADPGTTNAPGLNLTPGGPENVAAAREVAMDGLTRYSVHSWRDKDHMEWMRRLDEIATGSMSALLRELFTDSRERFRWEEFVVAEQRETRLEIRQAALGGFDEQTKNRMTFTVFATVSARDKNYPQWTPGDERSFWVSVVRDGGKWFVEDIRLTSDRS